MSRFLRGKWQSRQEHRLRELNINSKSNSGSPRLRLAMTCKGFTLAEVLITLVVIGIIAAITVPSVLTSVQNREYKVAYKKAYSDLSRAVQKSIAFGEFPVREKVYDATAATQEWNIIKSQFGIMKLCENNKIYDCWVNNERYFDRPLQDSDSAAFIDLSGRAWAMFYRSENLYLVDTNGSKKPNHFGKDRWAFTFADAKGKRICGGGDEPVCKNPGVPMKIIPFRDNDITTKNTSICNYPPCLYHSWLYQ